jgi:superfamily II DNA/RNA helicase
VFFTATWPREVQSLAMDFLRDPVHLTAGDVGVLNANLAITQQFIAMKEFQKDKELFDLLDKLNTAGEHKR